MFSPITFKLTCVMFVSRDERFGVRSECWFPLPPDAWVSTTAYLVRDTGRLLRAVRFLGSPDRMLAQIATVGAVFPPAVHVAGTSTMPRSFFPEDAPWT